MTDRRVITEALKAAIDKIPGALTRQHAGAYILRDEVHTAIAALIEREREECALVAEACEVQQEDDHGAANTGGASAAAGAIRERKPA